MVVTFVTNSVSQAGSITGLGIPSGVRVPYVHNSHGWFPLGSVLLAEGLDLEALDWVPSDMAVTGVRTVEGMDLVFGQGGRRTFDPATVK